MKTLEVDQNTAWSKSPNEKDDQSILYCYQKSAAPEYNSSDVHEIVAVMKPKGVNVRLVPLGKSFICFER